MKHRRKTACAACPFRRSSMPGWLGAYEDAEAFIATHYEHDVQNPCHTDVDYEDPEWEAKLDDATACLGQAVMYANSFKRPRAWSLPDDVERDDAFFRWADEFVAHHQRGSIMGARELVRWLEASGWVRDPLGPDVVVFDELVVPVALFVSIARALHPAVVDRVSASVVRVDGLTLRVSPFDEGRGTVRAYFAGGPERRLVVRWRRT